MNLTKNQIVIISVLAVGVIAYYMFFRKKSATSKMMMMAPKPPMMKPAMGTMNSMNSMAPGTDSMTPAMAENGYTNYQLDGGMLESSFTPNFYGPAQLLNGIGTAGSAGIGGMESSYDDLSSAPTEASLAGIGFNNNWLGY